jgi:hypothetical protein
MSYNNKNPNKCNIKLDDVAVYIDNDNMIYVERTKNARAVAISSLCIIAIISICMIFMNYYGSEVDNYITYFTGFCLAVFVISLICFAIFTNMVKVKTCIDHESNIKDMKTYYFIKNIV